MSLAPAVLAATTVMDVQVGQAFTANIGQAGDTVEAHFSAQGALEVTARGLQGSTLRPTVVVKDASGTVIQGSTRALGWAPGGAVMHYVTLPGAGDYYAEFGAASGSGGLWGRIDGRALSGSQPPPPDTTTLSGTVSDSLTGDPISGASVYVDGVLFAMTGANGTYSGSISAGNHAVRFEASGYSSVTQNINVVSGTPYTLNPDLLPSEPVIVDASVTGTPVPGALLTGVVNVTIPTGYNVNSITWTQKSGVPVSLGTRGAGGTPITLGTETAYKDELIHFLSEPPVGQEQLPPNVQLPDEFFGGLPSRFTVVGVNPFALEESALLVMEVEVDTDLGVFQEEVEIHTQLPWKVSTGLENVPFGDPVLFHGPDQAAYDWTLVDYPVGSMAALTDATTRDPWFTPDVPGLYEIEVTPEGAATPLNMKIYAGGWEGVIVDQDMDGRPVPDVACTACHNDLLAPDKFTPWAQTGHAEILTDNLDTSTHYSTSCFPCHTVGFNSGAGTGGVDEAADYQDFLGAGLLSHPGDNWTTMLQQFPDTARLSNIQCENCHGPQDSLGHGFGDPPGDPRVSLSADVCGSCHGEPLRHARFQQWQLSAHADYELAVDEGTSGNCARCHSANGFLAWVPVLLDNDPNTDPLDNVTVTWTESEIHPQTCVTCHDPHAEGSTTGVGSNATVRIEGDTPPLVAGFTATGVGRGAICMTCHNSRRGLRDDTTWPTFTGTSEAARMPHAPAQADVLMGQNAYLVTVPAPGGHATIEETCIACHMESTPPPDILSYNQGGTNHTFYASKAICADCHSGHLTAQDVQDSIGFLMEQVKEMIEDKWLTVMSDQIGMGYTIDLNGDFTVTDIADVDSVEFSETRGRQALIVTVSGTAYGPTRVSDIDVIDPNTMGMPPTPINLGSLQDLGGDAVLQAGWNYGLFHNDGSMGVHNPFFAADALIAARDALMGPAAAKSQRSANDVFRGWEGRFKVRTRSK